MTEEIFLTAKQLAEVLQVSEQAIRKWAREDKIPHIKVGISEDEKRLDYRFKKDEVVEFFKTRKLDKDTE